MKPAHSLPVFAFVLAAPLLAQGPASQPQLTVQPVAGAVHFSVHSEGPFVGAFVVSPTPTLMHFLVDLPPLLADGLVVAFGASAGDHYRVSLPEQMFPPGMMLHVQGVAIGARGVRASDVAQFVLDVTGEG